ncbi:MAG: hypothetical protein LWX07_13165, partial [Bacteroidetes bacterium]|nr:hypothetical protein [Bacteroidota bacterium]
SEAKYLELIQNDGADFAAAPDKIEDDAEFRDDVFNLPTSSPAPVKKEEKREKAEDAIFMEPAADMEEPVSGEYTEKREDFTDLPGGPENKSEEITSGEEVTPAGTKEPEKQKEEPGDIASFFEEVETETQTDAGEKKDDINIPLFEEEIKETDGKIPEDEHELTPVIQPVYPEEENIIPEPLKEPAYEEENFRDESFIPPVDTEVEQTLKEIEEETEAEINNADFLKYEKELYEKNRTINGLLDDLVLIMDSSAPDYEMKNAICDEIVTISSYMKEYSVRMSFEIISKVYSSFVFCLDKKFREISLTKENIEVFRSALEGVEKLVKGEELTGFDKTIKLLDELENDLNDLLAKRDAFEKKKFDFGEEERKIIEEFTDSSEREAYLALRERIMDTEEIFASITSEKERIAPFEVLRRLSSSFAQFREIVNIARILEMHKMAQLAEASYIFVKFLQNYRMDPYQREVAEVLNYIVYCCKLIYLDKPVKDLETFISYLNDPVKIFNSNKEEK